MEDVVDRRIMEVMKKNMERCRVSTLNDEIRKKF